MIQGSTASWQTEDWQEDLKNLVTRPEELIQQLHLDGLAATDLVAVTQQFPLRAPRDYLNQIPAGDPEHPLLKQILPSFNELKIISGYGHDPVGEFDQNPVPGLIHKYKGRVLLIVSSSCPIHCRYCFRRHFPYDENSNARQEWTQTLNYIQATESIHEVIFSGGDPLSAPDHHLAWLSSKLAEIPHLKRLRIHTRFPIVIPRRVTPALMDWLTTSRLMPVIVLHCNHPDEISPNVAKALACLKEAGIVLLNQSVLLKGVNDQVKTLTELSEKLFASGVLPYYLHLLDKVQGAAHFDIPETEAISLYKTLQRELPGYLLPKLVREESRQGSKTLLC